MEAILKLDAALFLLINTELTLPILDVTMQFVTNKTNFFHAALLGVIVMVLKDGKRGVRGLVLLILAVVISDWAADVLKNVFGRPRPCHALYSARLLVGCSGSYSFPSGHATNIFAAMAFLTARYRKWWPAFLFTALSVSYSRVYVGVHYPLDVAGGAVVGGGVALLFAASDKKLVQVVIDYIKAKRGSFEI